MIALFETVSGAFRKALYYFTLVAAAAAFITMLLVVANSLMRKGLNSPLEGTVEITRALLIVLIFFAIGYTQQQQGHIRVSLLTRHFSQTIQNGLNVFAMVVGCLFFAWASLATWNFAMESFVIGEQEWGSIRFPLYPIKFVVSIGLILLSIQFFLDAIKEVLVAKGLISVKVAPDVPETEI